MKQAMNPTVLEGIVRRIVEVAQPEKIILFGSAARGDMGPHSDVDLLVIKAGAFRRRDVARQIYLGLGDVEVAVDVVVVTPEDVERYGESHAQVIKPPLRDGKVLYAA